MSEFPSTRTVLDLGGGHGEQSLEFARRGLLVTMQDRTEVVDVAHRSGRLADAGVELFAGDFFRTLPDQTFDLVVCGLITNMFDEATNRGLLSRLHDVVAPGGGLVITTYLRGHDQVAAAFGLQMLVCTTGGDAHGTDDYHRWLTAAGFSPPKTAQLSSAPLSVLVARRE